MNYSRINVYHKEKGFHETPVKIWKKIIVNIWKGIMIFSILLGSVATCAGFGVWKGIIDTSPDISGIDVIPTGYSTTVLSSDGQEIAKLVSSGANRKYVTIDEVPECLQQAVVAIEDARFYEHNGIDIQGIVRAFVKGVSHGFKFRQGASTITQQLIKNNVLTSWTSEQSQIERFQRKIQEQYLAIELEQQVNNKQWILENYLNTINLGSNTLGVQAASEKYFGKDVSELTISEAAVIAGITKNPSGYNPIRHPEANKERRKEVLDAMLKQEFITKEQYDEAMEDDVYSRIAEYHIIAESNAINSYFVDALIEDVRHDLINKLGYTETEAYKALYQGGLTINSTQNLTIQQICEEEVNRQENYPKAPKYSFFLNFRVKKADGTYRTYTNQTMLAYYKKMTGKEDFSILYADEEKCREAIAKYEKDVLEEGDTFLEETEQIYITLQPQVALTVMDHTTGEVVAMVGGRGAKQANRTWNRATDTTRQPGSTFKILACYIPAFDTGQKTLASVQYDGPFTMGDKTYRNSDERFRGYCNIRTGITNSINIVALKTLGDIGVRTGYQYIQDFGFTTVPQDDMNLGLAIGGLTNGVKNIELTAAYASIANNGEYIEPSFYTTVYDHDGNLLLHNSAKEHRIVMKETTAWLITSAMRDVMTSGTGTRAYFGTKMAQAGKTGTTNDNRDTLMAGFTPYYTCVLWGGNDDNSKQAGNDTVYSKTIWREIMKRIHADLPAKDFTMPVGLTTAQVCKVSGGLPVEHVCDSEERGSMLYTEYFEEGTVPTEDCGNHIVINICSASGMPSNPFCPERTLTPHIYLLPDTPGSEDDKYMPPAELQYQICTVHGPNNH